MLGAGIGLIVTLYRFEFDSTAAGFLTIFIYLFQIVLLILTAIPNMIIGIAVGIVVAIIVTLVLHFVQKREIKKAPKNQGDLIQ